MTAPLIAADRAEEIATLRRFLDDAGFDAPHIQELLRTENELLARPRDVAVHLRRLRGEESAAATLVKLFVLGVTMERDVAEPSLAPLGTDFFEALALVREHEGGVRGTVRMVPHDEYVITSDRPDEETSPDHVAGVHRPSATLADLTIRRPVARVLDVGTGNGIQALLAAAHAEHVVATDVNARALVFAQFNAHLNGVDNVEFREGSFLEPVAGERFDLIVANPPYVISPESEFLFRDSGLGGDRVSEQLVQALPAHLEDGGFATVMISWIQDGDDAAARPRTWTQGSGCDAWIFHSRTDDALSTAAAWNRDAKSSDEYAERIDRWVDYYRAEAIEALAYGGIVLRRRQGENWARTAELPSGRLSTASAHLERMFAAQDFLHSAGGKHLLAGRFAFAEQTAIEQELTPSADGGWQTGELTLKLTEGLGFRAGLDEMTGRLVLRIKPQWTLRETLDGVADELGLDRDELHRAGTELVRRLIDLGFVVPV